jgi:hypothetical protein
MLTWEWPIPKTLYCLRGQVGSQPFGVHAEGERVILTRPEGDACRGEGSRERR